MYQYILKDEFKGLTFSKYNISKDYTIYFDSLKTPEEYYPNYYKAGFEFLFYSEKELIEKSLKIELESNKKQKQISKK
jgi:hypothetical protein